MAWGTVELHQEVERWLTDLTDEEFMHAAFYIDLLAESGVHLGEPYTRQLQGKLRELRFHDPRGNRCRITYFIASGRRIVLLTVFRKQRGREPNEIRRAVSEMERCVREGHDAEDADG